jgi:hypothetical protein
MASLASSFTSNTIAFFMGKQFERHWLQGQGSQIAVAGACRWQKRYRISLTFATEGV